MGGLVHGALVGGGIDAPGLEIPPAGCGWGVFILAKCCGVRAVPGCCMGNAERCVLLAQGADVPDDIFGRVDVTGMRVEVVDVVSARLAEVLKGALVG